MLGGVERGLTFDVFDRHVGPERDQRLHRFHLAHRCCHVERRLTLISGACIYVSSLRREFPNHFGAVTAFTRAPCASNARTI